MSIYSVNNFPRLVIKTDNSESRGQEEAGCMQRTNELFTGSTALKLVNAVNRLPLKPSFSSMKQ